MVVGSDELDRLADEIYRDRRITGSVYCGNCGYNLRTLPYMYVCPECGDDYNARPTKMKGIFLPSGTVFPLPDCTATLVFALSTTFLSLNAFKPLDQVSLVIAGFFAVFTLLFARQAYIGIGRYIRAVSIIRRIALDEADDA